MSSEVKGSKLPIWVLTPNEELQARKNLKKYTFQQCSEVIEAMMQCSRDNGVKVFPTCNKQRDAMSKCVLFYQNDQKYLDEQKDLLIKEKINKLQSKIDQSKKKK